MVLELAFCVDFFVFLLLASDLTLAGDSNDSVDQGGAPLASSASPSSLNINFNLGLLCKSCLARGILPFLTGVCMIMVLQG